MFRFLQRKPLAQPPKAAAEKLREDGNRMLAEGRLGAAEDAYRGAIAADPHTATAHLNLGYVLDEQGRRAEAAVALQRAVSLDAGLADAWYLLGRIAAADGRRADATMALERALAADAGLRVARQALVRMHLEDGRLDEAVRAAESVDGDDPNCPLLHLYAGMACARAGYWPAAAAHYRAEVALQPDLAEAHAGLGDALKAVGAYHDAVACYRRAVELAPLSASVHCALGLALHELGMVDAAGEHFAHAVELDPRHAGAHVNLGLVRHARGDDVAALAHFREALAVDPNHLAALHDIGSVCLKQGDLDEAIVCFRRALAVEPGYADAHLNLGTALAALGRTEEARASLHRAIALAVSPAFARQARSNLLMLESAADDAAPDAFSVEARQYGSEVAATATPFADWHARPRDAPLCVGFVSGDLRMHPVGYFLEGVLAQLADYGIEAIAYPTTTEADALTSRLRPHFRAWRPLAGIDDANAARRIHDDRVDVLVDLAGHTAGNRLPVFAWKPAPTQASWLGWWASTGVTAIDWFVADPVSLPEDAEHGFSEGIVRLPHTRLCFTPPVAAPDVAPGPASRSAGVAFACYQNLAKVNVRTLQLWARVLDALPHARIRVQDKHLDFPGPRAEFSRRLAEAGIASARVELFGRTSRASYLASYADVDIGLDTAPFTGGTTTCEALWMGVPTVTLAGMSLIGRQGASLMNAAGLPDWIAADEDAYVRLAIERASDIAALAKLRASLRERVRASPLCDALQFASDFADALHAMCACPNPRRR